MLSKALLPFYSIFCPEHLREEKRRARPPFSRFYRQFNFSTLCTDRGDHEWFYLPSFRFFPSSTRWSLILLGLSGLNANLWSGEPSSFSFFHKRVSYVAPASPVYFFFFLSGMNVLPSLEAIASLLSPKEIDYGPTTNDNQLQPTRCQQRQDALRPSCRSLIGKARSTTGPGAPARFSPFARLGR